MVDFSRCIMGSFNVCIPVCVKSTHNQGAATRLFLRCAMPHKLAESRSPGSVDEKTRCEVATYAWMQRNCPDVRIPYLYGFGLSDGTQFTHEKQLPLFAFLCRVVHRAFLRLRSPSTTTCSLYAPHPSGSRLSTSYMVLEDVAFKDSQMLSNSWQTHRGDPMRRRNLYAGIARIMLSLARVPQPRIGSFRFHDDGTVTLSNRPLTCAMMILENDGAPRAIPPGRTYATAAAYASELMALQDGRLATHPNAVFDAESCRAEMACRVTFRAAAHHFIDAARCEGPFRLRMDDLHPSNIFVDDAWNVKSLVDLEWIAAQPADMLAAPYWLTGCDPGELEGQALTRFDGVRREFMQVFEDEERRSRRGPGEEEAPLRDAIEEAWARGATWFWLGLGSVNAMHAMWDTHVRPRFVPFMTMAEEKDLSRLWCCESEAFVDRKVADYEAYCTELKRKYDEK
ncbi:aminoglycoside phosphotransferase [Colletotrichum sojae]|uniref:Aminoglycoside phosphotransferase n=1 Tax=Colletotrichum sojae TaxID=2175907 RepID=A0A8H6MJ62_9PEZI|nr:aminoglycoside phosphotransferase [Colletotrichum sojae]